MKWITSILVNWVTLMIVAGLFTHFAINGVEVALLAAFILTIVNTIVRPILIFFTLPITVLTLGIFLLVINAMTLLLTAALIEGFTITGFWTAFWAGMITGILNTLIQNLVVKRLKK